MIRTTRIYHSYQNYDNREILSSGATGDAYDPSALVSLRRFRGDMGVVPSTAWRWTKRGWLEKPINIGGRQYLTVAMIHRFLERAARGEFASVIKPPTRISASVNQNGGAV